MTSYRSNGFVSWPTFVSLAHKQETLSACLCALRQQRQQHQHQLSGAVRLQTNVQPLRLHLSEDLY